MTITTRNCSLGNPELCWKCKEDRRNEGWGHIPGDHCHHEPKEDPICDHCHHKPKEDPICDCVKLRNMRVVAFDDTFFNIEQITFNKTGLEIRLGSAIFCPKCGWSTK